MKLKYSCLTLFCVLFFCYFDETNNISTDKVTTIPVNKTLLHLNLNNKQDSASQTPKQNHEESLDIHRTPKNITRNQDYSLIPTEEIIKDKYQNNINHFSVPVRGEDNIHFLETSCAVNENYRDNIEPKLILDYKQACAIESAARANPDSLVYLFYTCSLDEYSVSRSSEMVQQVFSNPNVRLWHQNMSIFFQDTPLEEFYKSGKMKTSIYPIVHASDVMRFLTLWKFGGLYLDLDFIVKRSFTSLGTNFACAERNNSLGSAAMHFAVDPLGKKIAAECVEELRTKFNGKVWAYNGPDLITRVLRRLCRAYYTFEMTRAHCDGFAVLPPMVFYPISHVERPFYNEDLSAITMSRVMKSHAVHLWNSQTYRERGENLRMNSTQPIVLLQQKFCPAVHRCLSHEASNTVRHGPLSNKSTRTNCLLSSVFCTLLISIYVCNYLYWCS